MRKSTKPLTWECVSLMSRTRERPNIASTSPTTASHVTVFTSRPAEHNAPAAGKLWTKGTEEARLTARWKTDKHGRAQHNNRLYYLNAEVCDFRELVQWCCLHFCIHMQADCGVARSLVFHLPAS